MYSVAMHSMVTVHRTRTMRGRLSSEVVSSSHNRVHNQLQASNEGLTEVHFPGVGSVPGHSEVNELLTEQLMRSESGQQIQFFSGKSQPRP